MEEINYEEEVKKIYPNAFLDGDSIDEQVDIIHSWIDIGNGNKIGCVPYWYDSWLTAYKTIQGK